MLSAHRLSRDKLAEIAGDTSLEEEIELLGECVAMTFLQLIFQALNKEMADAAIDFTFIIQIIVEFCLGKLP